MERQKLLVWSNGKGYHYNFDCVNCEKEYELITGDGRYGNLGPFECPNCHNIHIQYHSYKSKFCTSCKC